MKSSYKSTWPGAAAEEVSVAIATLTGDPWLSLTLNPSHDALGGGLVSLCPPWAGPCLLPLRPLTADKELALHRAGSMQSLLSVPDLSFPPDILPLQRKQPDAVVHSFTHRASIT